MIGVDTNILVHAHRRDSPWHGSASRCVRTLAEGTGKWLVPQPCLHEFFAVVTNPRIHVSPTSPERAMQQIEAWCGSPSLVLARESDHHWETMRELISMGRVAGPVVHDARVAAICIDHGVRELWAADRDFSRFSRRLATRNPLVAD